MGRERERERESVLDRKSTVGSGVGVGREDGVNRRVGLAEGAVAVGGRGSNKIEGAFGCEQSEPSCSGLGSAEHSGAQSNQLVVNTGHPLKRRFLGCLGCFC